MIRIDILSATPELLESPFSGSILRRAIEKNIVEVYFHNLRDYSTDKHHKIDDYHISIEKCFERIYGKVTDYVIIGVTPNYNTKKTSSLIYMINHLIQKSNKKQSQFIMDLKKFKSATKELETANKKYIIYGLSYALMDLIEKSEI